MHVLLLLISIEFLGKGAIRIYVNACSHCAQNGDRDVPADSTPSSSTAKHCSSDVDPRWRSDFPWNVLLLILDSLNFIHMNMFN